MSDGLLPALGLLAAVGSPLAAALALGVPGWRPAAMRYAPWAAAPAVLLALAGSPGLTLGIPWLVKHTVLTLDPVGRVFLGFTSVLWLAAGWYGRAFLADDPHPARFQACFLAAMAGNFALILAGDVPTFYLGFAVMGLASGGLVLHRGDAESLRAGTVYLALAVAGEVLLFTGLVFLATAAGTTSLAALHRAAPGPVALALLLIGCGIKAGALSLHFWLPLAHPAAPVPASAVLSGAMIKAGLLGWLRFLPLGEAALPGVGFGLIAAGLGAAVGGTLPGVAQRNPKTVLAYSSISQMGIITVGVGIGLVRPEAWPEVLPAILVYAAHHGLAKGALFLGVGPARRAGGGRDAWIVRAGLLVPALALSGAPFSSGAVAKLALKGNVAHLPGAWAAWVGILLPVAAVGTVLKMARFLWLTWPGRGPAPAASSRALWAPWLFAVAAVLGGVWLLPGLVEPAVGLLAPGRLWAAAWPVLAGGTLAALAALARDRLRRAPLSRLPAGDIVVVLERLLRLGRGLWPAAAAPGRPPAEDGARRARARARLGERLRAAERGMRAWPAAGLSLIALIVLFFWLLAGAGP